jgi:hypothetical protein
MCSAGYVLFDWDQFFASFMLGLSAHGQNSGDAWRLALSNIIQVRKRVRRRPVASWSSSSVSSAAAAASSGHHDVDSVSPPCPRHRCLHPSVSNRWYRRRPRTPMGPSSCPTMPPAASRASTGPSLWWAPGSCSRCLRGVWYGGRCVLLVGQHQHQLPSALSVFPSSSSPSSPPRWDQVRAQLCLRPHQELRPDRAYGGLQGRARGV